MAAEVRIEMNSAGVRAFLQSSEVEQHLLGLAQRIADAAGGEPDYHASSMVGKTRARASVITASAEAKLAEATERTLTRSIDAARGG